MRGLNSFKLRPEFDLKKAPLDLALVAAIKIRFWSQAKLAQPEWTEPHKLQFQSTSRLVDFFYILIRNC